MDDSFRVLIPEDDQHAGEARFRSVFENALIGMYRTSPDGRILMANSAAIRMLGYASFEALAQRNIEQDAFAHAESRAAYRVQLDRVGVVHGLESVWLRHDGSAFGVRVSAHAIRDAQA